MLPSVSSGFLWPLFSKAPSIDSVPWALSTKVSFERDIETEAALPSTVAPAWPVAAVGAVGSVLVVEVEEEVVVIPVVC